VLGPSRRGWTDRLLRHRRAIAAVWVVLTVGGVWASATLSDHLSQRFDAPDRPAFAANEEIVRALRDGGTIAPIVLVARDGSAEARTAALRRVAAAVPGARTIVGGRALTAERGAVQAALVFPPPGRTAPDENPPALAAAERAAAQAGGGATIRVTGLEALSGGDGGGGIGLLLEVLIGGVGALVVLAVVFGSPLAAVPLVVAAVSILTTFLLLRGLAAAFTISFVVQFLVGLIGLGVAIDYSLLLVVRWREERDRGARPRRGRPPRHGHRGPRDRRQRHHRRDRPARACRRARAVHPLHRRRRAAHPARQRARDAHPAAGLLATAGPRLDRRRAGREAQAGAGWTRWSAGVVRRRVPAAVVGLVVMLALAAAATGLRPGQPSVDTLSPSGPARDALETLERSGLGAGTLTRSRRSSRPATSPPPPAGSRGSRACARWSPGGPTVAARRERGPGGATA
jgi:RND superfamily putative drug exporter